MPLAPAGVEATRAALLESDRVGDATLVSVLAYAGLRPGEARSDAHWRNSRKRVFQPAAKATGLDDLRPYDLRHSFVSLLLSERRSLLEVAKQAGHSPTMALATYGHVIEARGCRDGVR